MASAAPSAELVLHQVDRILASAHFSRSQTLARFLRFVVQLALDGKSDELKEYRLGVDVFERGAGFDPRIDPIVRLQAAKLRSRLVEYYSDEGRDDLLVIGIPKGRYAPSFTHVAKSPPAKPSPERQSIAVLPFVNMSADPENEYFSDGLTEELINLLTAIPGLRVVARTSVFSFKNTAKDIREIGSQLNVQTVLEGSVRKAGNQLRVTAQLIDVASGYHLLSRVYPRELQDVFAVQEELANAVVTEIMPQVRGEPQNHVLRVQAADVTAYNLYLKGMFTLARDFVGPAESVQIFERVLKLDPGYAPASAGLAYAYFLIAWYSIRPAKEAMPLAKEAALNAIRLDPTIALGHTALGAVQAAYDWNWIDAEQSFRNAITLQPGFALAYHLYAGALLLAQCRLAEAVDAIGRALALNPYDAMLRAAATHVSSLKGDYDAAVEHYSFGVEINPKSPLVYRAIGLSYQSRGLLEKAIEAFRIACDVSGRTPIALGALGNVLAESGDRAGAEALLEEIKSKPGRHPLAMVAVLFGLGKMDEAMDWLEKAIEDREPHTVLIPMHYQFNRCRNDARFIQLMGRTGLTLA